MNDVWWSTDGIVWTEFSLSQSYSARSEHSFSVHDNKLWIIGGWDGSNYLNDVWYVEP